MPKPSSKLRVDISSLVGSIIFLWLIQLPLPLSLALLVYEKEKRLRLMMRMHGLSNGVYTFVTYLYLILLYVVYVAGMMAVGAAVGLGFFRNNSAGACTPACLAPLAHLRQVACGLVLAPTVSAHKHGAAEPAVGSIRLPAPMAAAPHRPPNAGSVRACSRASNAHRPAACECTADAKA
jgi:hypothetical protein